MPFFTANLLEKFQKFCVHFYWNELEKQYHG